MRVGYLRMTDGWELNAKEARRAILSAPPASPRETNPPRASAPLRVRLSSLRTGRISADRLQSE